MEVIVNVKQIKRRYITLIEIMVVITLIALIAGALAYNYYGSLEAGRAFKTKANIERIETILNMKVAEDPRILNEVPSRWEEIVAKSPLVKSSSDIVNDGWGNRYVVTVDNNGNIKVTSEALNGYEGRKQDSGG